MKGVIWADVLQMAIYIGGAILALYVLIQNTPSTFNWAEINEKWQIFNFSFHQNLAAFFTTPYTFLASIIGGTFLSMASHGTDQLIVQRLLTTKTLKDAQKALIGSGLLVILQFALFLIVGIFLYVFFNQIMPGESGAPFLRADEIFPFFIIHHLPAGIKGFIIAGLFATAISTLAGSISSLSSSAMLDIYKSFFEKTQNSKRDLTISRILTVFSAVILSMVAFVFIHVKQSVVEIAHLWGIIGNIFSGSLL
jgi:Na+/proline symporter